MRPKHLVGKFQVAPAVAADLLVERQVGAALLALAPRLVRLVPPQQRGGRPEDRDDRPDQEPEDERAALPPADEARGEAAEEADDEVGHAVLPESADRPDDREDSENG